MIPKNILKAFGFRKCKKQELSGFSNGSYYNPFLDIYYDPEMHDDKRFASNVVSSIAVRYHDALVVNYNFAEKVVGEK
jgi:hypothetical protein